MDRSMAYDLDGVLGTRNDGQLISQQAPRAIVTRAPGMVEEGDQSGGGFNSNRMITRDTQRVPNLAGFNVELPIIGQVHWGSLALGGIAALVAYKLMASEKGKRKLKAVYAA